MCKRDILRSPGEPTHDSFGSSLFGYYAYGHRMTKPKYVLGMAAIGKGLYARTRTLEGSKCARCGLRSGNRELLGVCTRVESVDTHKNSWGLDAEITGEARASEDVQILGDPMLWSERGAVGL